MMPVEDMTMSSADSSVIDPLPIDQSMMVPAVDMFMAGLN